MCVVTFIPGGRGGYRLTSSRDERVSRPRAIPPKRYAGLIYPMDPLAGGSWIGLKGNSDAGVLLNGAFTKHMRLVQYRRSRGLVFLDIMRSEEPLDEFKRTVLKDIEPFTVLLVVGGRLFACRWDGVGRHVEELDAGRPHIWSSVTLYDEPDRVRRETQFEGWSRGRDPGAGGVLDFHRKEAKRGEVATVSITTVEVRNGKGKVRYMDMGGEGGLKGKRSALMIRLRHWEYWPFSVVYAPVFLYWAWLSLRARSLFFFSTANPRITNSGFLMESKRQIYGLMPDGVYPKTIYCKKDAAFGGLIRRIGELGLAYPVMAKPDIGQRGLSVKLLADECQLVLYAKRSKVDFLVQEYIDYPLEIGVFYYRIPGEEKGRISGIVGKELLSVMGDGRSTVEALLRKNERYVLQLPALRQGYGRMLGSVPAEGEVLRLAPYGNHSRGAKFLDCSDRITPRLEATIDAVCRRIPEFYFGRLDIRFCSWPQLEAGEAYSIIELNGAGSEPTHIYDPGHSLVFAWREIRRHLDILFAISRANARRGHVVMGFWQGVRMLRAYSKHEKLISG